MLEENGVRCTLVEGESNAMLVDTGFGTGDLRAACEKLTQKPIFVVTTHADGDHVGCNALFETFYMHPAEYDRYAEKTGTSPAFYTPLWEGQVLELGTYHFEVVLIPGHTPGSIALLEREARLLIGGDSVQRGAIFMFGPGRNMPAFKTSMEKMMTLVPHFDTVIPSHGPLQVKADVVEELLEGANNMLKGNITGEDPQRDLPCQLYRYKGVAFLAP
ncbi:MBL fold metallo-hydrolase [Ruminococcaceae bacterium OttesenSCG-928-N02]|nr:MBL fold metallo-hydrolase [Ruminococcaceae bacterium OttesenSCG-928-N02]